MLVDIGKATVSNVWKVTGRDRNDGHEFSYNRALVIVEGEPPLQLGVREEDYDSAVGFIGKTGQSCIIDIDAQPGRRPSVKFCGLQ